jgi:hypothetical protein
MCVHYSSQGYLFVDVKPENFMIKNVAGKEKVYFIDLGLMEKFTQYMAGGAQRAMAQRAFAGTAKYSSLSVHAGGMPSRKDDIEAVVSLADYFKQR